MNFWVLLRGRSMILFDSTNVLLNVAIAKVQKKVKSCYLSGNPVTHTGNPATAAD